MSAHKGAVVYVTTIPLKYEVMAVAWTEEESRRLAAKLALQRLREAGAVRPETSTTNKILAWWEPTTTRVPVGSAVLEGNE